MNAPRRLGLVGTGYWADVAHATAADRAPSWTLSAVWGRDTARAEDLAARHGAPHAGSDFDAFLEHVDAVTFAVPPAVQSEFALRAIAAGKHVALEKPIALTTRSADALVEAADDADVAAIVLFTMLYDPRVRAIIERVRGGEHWVGGTGLWLGSALGDENPFNTPWRHDKGGLWDVGPHAVSVLWRTLGPIIDVRTTRGADDLVHLAFTHEDGRTSTTSLTLNAPDAADGFSTMLWGPGGRLDVPVDDVDFVDSFTRAYEELAELITTGDREHDCDIRFGREVVRVLSAAEAAGFPA